MTEIEILHGKNHVLAIDNWYTSIEAVNEVHNARKQMEVLGTIRVNKRGIPKEGIFKKSGAGKKLRGTYEVRKVKDKSLYFVSWMDSKPVHLLSTFKPTGQTNLRKTKHSQGGCTETAVSAPSTIDAYNRCMGGTDRFDQLLSYYDDRSKTLSWKLRVITHFFRGSCINSMILKNLHLNEERTLLECFQEIIAEWTGSDDCGTVDDDSSVEEQTGMPCVPMQHYQEQSKQRWMEASEFRKSGFHSPQRAVIFCQQHNISRGDPSRARCKVCGSISATVCDTCGVQLCVAAPNGSDCFRTFHTKDSW